MKKTKARKNLLKGGQIAPIKVTKQTKKANGFKSMNRFAQKTQKFFSIEEQIKREKIKNKKLKEKEQLFNLQQSNIKLKNKMTPKEKDPFKDFFS